MGSYFHRFYYRISDGLETTRFHHSCGRQVDKSNTFIPVKSTHKTDDIAKIFMKEIFKLHGLSKAIISDRDVKFTFNFWKGLFANLGTQLNFNTSYHPQIDGKTKRVNQVLEDMLRMYVWTNQPSGTITYTW